MSSDNGVYILKTRNTNKSFHDQSPFEYRVAYLSAIDNIDYGCDTPECIMENARKMWAGTPVVTDRGLALEFAHDLADTIDILEYGVSVVDLSDPAYPGFLEIDPNAEKAYDTKLQYLDTAGQSQE